MRQIFKYLTFSLLLVLMACRDEFADLQTMQLDDTRAVTQVGANDNTGLLLMSDNTWKATRRVPLTGVGRVIGNMSPGLVSALGGQKQLDAILDHDIENSASLAGLATVDAIYSQKISVKDMYRTYSGGQKAGFVYDVTNSSLLNLDVLKLFTITLYNDGEEVGTYNVSESADVLGLNLINIQKVGGVPQQVVAVDVPEGITFDEIAFGYGGVSAEVFKSMHIYYAFVGETPMRTTVKDTESCYEYAEIYTGKWHTWTNWANADQLTDNKEDNGPVIELVEGLLNILKGGCRVTVNFGEPVPAGSEIGFVYTSSNVLSLGVGSVSLSTYPVKNREPVNNEIENYSVGSVVGASIIGGGKGAYSFITTKDCQALYSNITKLDVNLLSYMQYHYAFTRAKTEEDVTSYFNFPEKVTLTTSSFHVLQPEKGTLNVEFAEKPEGSDPAWSDEQSRITGMTEPGEYAVTFTYQKDGYTFTQKTVFVKEDSTTPQTCNQWITISQHGAEIKDSDDSWGISIFSPGAQDAANLLDGNPNTCMTHYGLIDLLAKKNIVAVDNISFDADEQASLKQKGYRAGFVMQVSKELLSLNALNFLYVDLYKDGQKLQRTVSGTRPTVDLGLINGDQGKVRIGGEMEKGSEIFDEIRLYYGGVAALNFNSIKVYGVFYEPADLICASNGVSESCMEMVTPYTYGAYINYDETKYKNVAGVANGMYSLDNVLDDDKNTYSTIATTNVIGETVLAVKFNKMNAGQWIGAMIRDVNGVADVKLLDALTFEVYNDGVLVADYDDYKDLLDVSLIGYEDKVYLELQPDTQFDEVRISAKAVAGVLEQLMVYGIYTRMDADGDGIPDCGEEENPDGGTDKIYPTETDLHVCGDATSENPVTVNIPVVGGKQGNKYMLVIQRYQDEDLEVQVGSSPSQTITYTGNGKLSFPLEATGVYIVDIKSEDGNTEYCNDMKVTLHPTKTTWKGTTGEKETRWDLWTNWSKGTPWGCTDVVIPAGLTNYPVLVAGREYNCARIQFAAGEGGKVGKVFHTQHLVYDQAWVDYRLNAGQYYWLSAPLKDTYTGDVFGKEESLVGVDAESGDYAYAQAWKLFNATSDLTSGFRFTPRVYQYVFGGLINNQTGSGTEQLQPGDDNWTPPFNLVAQKYEAGKAFQIKMGGDGTDNGNSTYMLRWPKRYTSYGYYDLDKKTMIAGRSEYVSRTYAGRFIYEDSKGGFSFPLHVKLENDRPGAIYLAGNPFMADIAVGEFFAANAGVGEIRLCREGKITPISRDLSSTERIQPMEGFLIVLRSPYSETNRYSYYVNFTDGMLK